MNSVSSFSSIEVRDSDIYHVTRKVLTNVYEYISVLSRIVILRGFPDLFHKDICKCFYLNMFPYSNSFHKNFHNQN